jgi:hypothetical protein
MDFPGFDFLKKTVEDFVDRNVNGADLTGRAVRTAATGAKATVDKAVEEFPADFIKGFFTDLYETVASQDVADGLSMAVRSMDEQQIKETLDILIADLKKDEIAGKVADTVKDLLSKYPTEEIEAAFDQFISGRSYGEQMIAKMFFQQVKPVIDEMRDMSAEDLIGRIQELADTIPTDALAAQVGAMTREFTPERISKQTHDLVGKLPSPATVSGIFHDVAAAASSKLDGIAQSGSLDDAKALLSDFAREAVDIAKQRVSNDNAAKKNFNRKKGGDFNL